MGSPSLGFVSRAIMSMVGEFAAAAPAGARGGLAEEVIEVRPEEIPTVAAVEVGFWLEPLDPAQHTQQHGQLLRAGDQSSLATPNRRSGRSPSSEISALMRPGFGSRVMDLGAVVRLPLVALRSPSTAAERLSDWDP